MKFDESKYNIWTWKSPALLHWIINPGLAILEIFVGMRIPKVMLFEKGTEKPFIQTSIIPCPHCTMMHQASKWSPQHKTFLKNWFGYYCDNCGGIIPCLTNLTTYLILGLTFPIWYWFKDDLKAKWLKAQPARFINMKHEVTANPYDNIAWIKQGLIWGFFMYIIMTFAFPYFSGQTIDLRKILIGIPVWTLAGLLYGYTMKWWMGKKA